MLNAAEEMTNFLNLIASDPDICRVPVMIDSSRWEVIEAGLRCVQGKPIVNSLSLKEGEGAFLEKAMLVRQYGAALVVMLFDETGQADTYERRIAIAERSYRLLTNAGFAPQDIVFDPNVLAVATGIAQHNAYARDFIRACSWIKANLPHAKISGGVSNLSFSFRGSNAVRAALHAVFLYHAVRAGLDMCIAAPSILHTLAQINGEAIAKDGLLQLCEEVILYKNDNAAERLVEYAISHKDAANAASAAPPAPDAWRALGIDDRLKYAVLKGVTEHLGADLDEALRRYTAMQVIEQPLMDAMNEVGELFGEGKMFLPQVVKSARALRTAVGILEPHLKAGKDLNALKKRGAKKILLATVKGDVHDIGKNIVNIVLACNGFEVIDLGVMTPVERILEGIEQHSPDLLGLSGLITPSLEEMEIVASQMNACGLNLPLLIGGATTTPLHTALRLDLAYPHRVFYVRDASQAAGIARQLSSVELKHAYTTQQQRRNEELRRLHQAAQQRRPAIDIEEARRNKMRIDWRAEPIPALQCGISAGQTGIDVLRPFIDWSMFFYAWGFKGKHPDLLAHPEQGSAARQLLDDAEQMLQTLENEGSLSIRWVTGFFAAASSNEDILIYDPSRANVLATLRTCRQMQKMAEGVPNLSMADFIAPQDAGREDFIGLFALSVQPNNPDLFRQYRQQGNEYDALLVETLCHRLAEACAEHTGQNLPVPCLRVTVGYHSLPDHSQKKVVFDLLNAPDHIHAALTDTYMIQPAAAECGLLFANRQARYF